MCETFLTHFKTQGFVCIKDSITDSIATKIEYLFYSNTENQRNAKSVAKELKDYLSSEMRRVIEPLFVPPENAHKHASPHMAIKFELTKKKKDAQLTIEHEWHAKNSPIIEQNPALKMIINHTGKCK